MKIAHIQFSPWGKIYSFSVNDLDLKKGDKVLVTTEMGRELGEILDIINNESEESEKNIHELKPIIRKATLTDLKKVHLRDEKREEFLKDCQEIIEEHSLPMKLVGVRYSYDGGKLVFGFIAPHRIDFRELVVDLTHKFQKTVRLIQVDNRQSVKTKDTIGVCGRKCCCSNFIKNLDKITIDTARNQQIAHRGKDRLTGVCGHFLCCLKFEEELYKDLATKMPALGSVIKTKQGKGKVVDWHILKQSVDVELEDGMVVETPLE